MSSKRPSLRNTVPLHFLLKFDLLAEIYEKPVEPRLSKSLPMFLSVAHVGRGASEKYPPWSALIQVKSRYRADFCTKRMFFVVNPCHALYLPFKSFLRVLLVTHIYPVHMSNFGWSYARGSC